VLVNSYVKHQTTYVRLQLRYAANKRIGDDLNDFTPLEPYVAMITKMKLCSTNYTRINQIIEYTFHV